MRVLVCGGRDFVANQDDHETLARHLPPGSVLIHGDARGADRWAARFAVQLGVDVEAFPADWQTHGLAAGPIRNQRMLDEGCPDVVLAFPGGRGTADMIKRALKARVKLVMVSR